jgi:hypothetical protein
MSGPNLADAIAQLREQISLARQEGEGKDVRFAAKTIEVELSLEFGVSGEVKAGVPKWIPFVEIGAKAGGSQKSLNKVKLTLEIDSAGQPSKNLISDDKGPELGKPNL